MLVCITLSEILQKCNDWEYFCKEEGYSEYVVNEGGGYIELRLTEYQAKKYGLIKD